MGSLFFSMSTGKISIPSIEMNACVRNAIRNLKAVSLDIENKVKIALYMKNYMCWLVNNISYKPCDNMQQFEKLAESM